MTLQETIEQIHPLSKEAMDRAKAHWDGIAKPLHSLGKLEERAHPDCRNHRKRGDFD